MWFFDATEKGVSVGNMAGEKSSYRIYVGFDATGRDLSVAFVWVF